MNYKDTLEFLFSKLPAYHRIGKAAYKGSLDTTITLDNYFDNPHTRFCSIHIAGTNGKGSVAHMIASVLQEAGLRTGLYTSPHLRDFRERIKVNGEMIPESSVIEFTGRHKHIFEKLEPSFFEMTVAMAFNYFAEREVDAAVIETGLGGRLDSTNIITPVLSVITNIGHDHLDLLGDTPEKIALEKAGIIKRGIPVVISETQPSVRDVFISKAAETGSVISFADERFSCLLEKPDAGSDLRRYTMKDLLTLREHMGISVLGGDYQSRNLRAVYSAFIHLQPRFGVSAQQIAEGIKNVVKNTGLLGRWQIMNHKPLTICDTGHNREGIEFVVDQLGNIPKTELHMIIGFVDDKDLNSILIMLPHDARYYFTKASVPRALNEEKLKAEAAGYNLSGNSYPDVRSALNDALENAGENDVIFIGGSTFVVAEVV